jgi:tRNA pseudouridine38-40 synthase
VAPVSFHARFSARAKTYRYRLWNAPVDSPFDRRYAWHLAGSLQTDAMVEAARFLVGEHDFVAFQAAGSDAGTTVRTVTRCEVQAESGILPWTAEGSMITVDITGTGFLRHMVRAIVGSLVEVGRGRQEPLWIADVIARRDRAAAGRTAPALGLFLVAVDYEDALAAEP